MSSGSNGGGLGALVAKNCDATSYHELLYQFGPFCTEFRKSTTLSQMHQNCTKHTKTWVQGPMGVDWLPWLRKIATRLRTTNFCSSSARFAPSFVTQPNGHKCTKILYKPQKNMSWGSNGVDWVHWFRKIPTRLRGTNFCTSSARFAPSFVSQSNGPQCTKIIQNAPEHEFRVQWDGSGAFVSKNFEATSYHKLLYQFGPFCTEFRKSTKWSQMHKNCMKCTKTWV